MIPITIANRIEVVEPSPFLDTIFLQTGLEEISSNLLLGNSNQHP